ncbi:MAG TPA: VOC family protein [Streptosporangiaceae bacterium]
MPQIRSYDPGTPCWVDLATPDIGSAEAFYGSLFGWVARTSAGPESEGYTSFYTFFTLDGGATEVAGAMPLTDERQPPVWTTYVSVSDVDATAHDVQAAGGQILIEPDDILKEGRVTVFADPQGAVIAAWQPNQFQGAAVANEANTYCWSELAGRDIEAAKAFYPRVFGWEPDTHAFGASTYTEWQVDGRSVAGMVQMDEEWPEDLPPYWSVYFAVDDCDATAARAVELGGAVTMPPTDIPVGRFAVIDDPQGAHFHIIRLTESGV